MLKVKRWFASIRIKIILLSLLGIFGMCMIAGVYKYLEYTESTYQKIGQMSQEIVRATDGQVVIEEKFIATSDKGLIQKHKDLQNSILNWAENIKRLSTSEDINTLSGNILSISRNKGESFESVITNVISIDQKQVLIIRKLSGIRDYVQKAVDMIEYQATEKIMQGELLSSAKSTLLVQLKDFTGLWNLRLINIQGLFIKGDKKDYDASKAGIEKKIKQKKEDINTVVGSIEDTELVGLWKNIEAELPRVDAIENEVAGLWEENQSVRSRLETLAEKAQQTALDIERTTQQILSARRHTGNIVSLAVTVSGIGILLVLGWVILRTIIKPITETVGMLKDIAQGEGDLTRNLEIKTENEIGDMARWFNTFIENIRAILKEVMANAGQLNESSGSLANISAHMSRGAEDTTTKSNTVAAASEQMSANIASVASAMEQATGNMNTVASATEQMNATIEEIARNAEKARNITSSAVDQAANASQQMDELGSAAQEIGKVIATITEISEQVNLLALNATIEAARAGDAGKGFAVVANEIKELARQTAEATGEIKQRVSGIQGSTNNTIDGINSITKVVNEVNEIVSTIASAVEEQSVTTKEIAGNVAQASIGINEVNESMAQSSCVSSDIAQEITQVSQAADEMANSSAQINMNSVELSKLAGTLNDMVGRFKI
jgi:methyl-accepting chemotaxis protein